MPSACASEPARSIGGTSMATSPQRSTPDGAAGLAPRPPAAAPRARDVPPSGAQGKEFGLGFRITRCMSGQRTAVSVRTRARKLLKAV